MDEPRSRPAQHPEYESQVRRAQRGVVAGYIHEVSERHGNVPEPDCPETPVGSNSR
jgi:hypothetical protein